MIPDAGFRATGIGTTRRCSAGPDPRRTQPFLASLFQPVWQTGIRGGAEFSLALVVLGGVCAVGELAATGVTGGAVLRRGGWFDPGLIDSSAESLH